MVSLFGCTGKKYKVDYCGQEGCYSNAKMSYRAGEQVELYYELIATDTDYSFYLDGESINYQYDDQHGFVIKFIMPDRDVKLECVMKNTMEYDPSAVTTIPRWSGHRAMTATRRRCSMCIPMSWQSSRCTRSLPMRKKSPRATSFPSRR